MSEHRLDRYEILDEIRKGGMGTVHHGIDRVTGNRVAFAGSAVE